jgi:hypothetical protein
MKTPILLGLTTLLACSLTAAGATPRDEVTSAAKALAEKPNYSWTTTVTVPEGARFRPGPTEGQTEKDGVTHLTMTFGERTVHALRQGEKGAITGREGEWQSLSDVDGSEGPGRFYAAMLRNIQTPAAQALELAGDAKELRKEGDAYRGELTEDGAKELLRFRRRADDGPEPRNAKGNVAFWVKDGVLSKVQYHVQGTVTGFDGNDIDVDRTTTIEIKEVGSTKMNVPEEGRKKLS